MGQKQPLIRHQILNILSSKRDDKKPPPDSPNYLDRFFGPSPPPTPPCTPPLSPLPLPPPPPFDPRGPGGPGPFDNYLPPPAVA